MGYKDYSYPVGCPFKEITQRSHEQLGYLGLKHYRLQDAVRNSKPNIRSNLDPDPGLLKPYNAHEI